MWLLTCAMPALPAQLSAVLFKQWMVVASGSCPRDLNKILSSHFLASRVLVDLSVHCPSSVGAGNIGAWSKCSSGLSASLATLTNSKTQGVFPTPHTGATKGMESPCFCTSLAVLWLRVLYSRYPVILPSISTMSAVWLYTHRRSDHLLLEYNANRKHPAANLSTIRLRSLDRNSSSDATSTTLKTLACRFSCLLEFANSQMFMAFGVIAVATCGMFKTFSQKLTASTKLDNADGDASCSCRCSKYASTSAAVKGKGVTLKENLVNQCVNLMIELALFNTVFWLRLPNSGRRPDKPLFATMSYMSYPSGHPLRPRAKMRYHFSKALLQRAANISESASVSLKSIHSWNEPLMRSTLAVRCDSKAIIGSSSKTGTGWSTGVGTIGVSSPNTKLMPGSSHGMVTERTGGVAAHRSPMILLKLSASSGWNDSSNSVSVCSGSWGGSSSLLGCLSPSSTSSPSSKSGTGLPMSSEATSEKLSWRELMLLKSCEGPYSGHDSCCSVWLGQLRVPDDAAVMSYWISSMGYLAQAIVNEIGMTKERNSRGTRQEGKVHLILTRRVHSNQLPLCALARSTCCKLTWAAGKAPTESQTVLTRRTLHLQGQFTRTGLKTLVKSHPGTSSWNQGLHPGAHLRCSTCC